MRWPSESGDDSVRSVGRTSHRQAPIVGIVLRRGERTRATLAANGVARKVRPNAACGRGWAWGVWPLGRNASSDNQTRRFSAGRLLQLRRELLTTGLDLPTIGRDAAEIWSAEWRSFAGVQIVGSAPNGLPDSAPQREDFDFIERLGRMRKTKLKALRADDAAYREALVTAASLGSSVEASRIGRRALLVAAASLAVATAALLVANTSANTLWSELVDWLRR